MSLAEHVERLKSLPPQKRHALLEMLRAQTVSSRKPRGIAACDHSGALPLSFAQERLWFLERLQPGRSAYNVFSAVHLRGRLSRTALRRGLTEIVRRHKALRTYFRERAGEPLQEILLAFEVPVPEVDFEAVPEDDLRGAVDRLLWQESRRPIDLTVGPMLRVCLVRRRCDDHLLCVTMHHIVSDGWSVGNFNSELATLYTAFATGRPPSLPELPIQYADYVVWQRGEEQARAMAADLDYWRGRLAGAPAVLELPTDRPRGAQRSVSGGLLRFGVEPVLTAALERLGRECDATPFMVLLAGFQALLGRLSGQDDVVVGSPVANRGRPELEPLVGYFVNMLALRADLSGDPSFRDLLRRVRDNVLGAFDHQELPFERLLDELDVERSLSTTPLFQVTFALQNAPAATIKLDGDLVLEPVETDNGTTKFDLSFALTQVADRIESAVQYSKDLFEATTIVRFWRHFQRLLHGVAADPDARLRELSLMGRAERHQLLREWSDGAGTKPFQGALHQLFERWAETEPAAPAVTFEGETSSYSELNAQANDLAHRLLARGLAPGERVGLLLERGAAMVTAILGVLKAGGAYVPLDPHAPQERTAFQLRDAAAPILVSASGIEVDLSGWHGHVVLIDRPASGGPAGNGGNPGIRTDPSSPAYVIYTSGSTGKPKGVVVTHGNVTRLFTATEHGFDFGASDVWTLFHSFAFDFSVWELWGALLYGGRLVVVPYEVSRSPEAFHELLSREGVTVLNQTPSAFRQLVRLDADRPVSDLGALRWVVFGGEALDPAALLPWIDRHGEERPRLVNMYGITETTVHVTYRRLRRRDAETAGRSMIGGAIPDLSVQLLDRTGRPVPIGVAGEICVGGAGVAAGYLGRPALMAQRYVPDPFTARPGGRLYRSGDLACWRPAGDLEYLGRADFQVKIRGFRIELGEIETTLAQHPAVRQAVVLARDDMASGGDEHRLVAYLSVSDGEPLRVEALRAWLKERLPEYMVPAFFVELEAFPLTANGKLDRGALPVPDGARPDLEVSYTPPRTAREEKLARVWAETLGVARVGIHDNFFALGGDSILSLRMVSLAEEEGLRLAMADLFRHQTVAELAAVASDTAEAGQPEAGSTEMAATAPFSLVSDADRALLPADVEDAYPLTMLQAGMLYHMELTADEPFYHNVDSWHLEGRFEPGPFRVAVDRIVARHPVLRTSFDLTSYSEPLQLVHRNVSLDVEVDDLRHLSTAEQEERIEARITREKRRLFDFSRAPQLRFHVDLRTEETFQFTLTENHAILDGWSLHSVLTQIFQLYFQLLAGEAPPEPPPLELTYRDFVALERQTLASPEAAAYWHETLSDCDPCELAAWPGWSVAGDAPRTRDLIVDIPAEVSDGLKALARSTSVPLKSVLFAAHLKVMGLLSGRRDVLTGIASNGRPEGAQGDQVCGLFLNSLPLRFQLTPSSWRDLVRSAMHAEESMLPHRRYPLAALQQRQGELPLIEVNFNYTHFHVLSELAQSGEIDLLDFKKAEGASFKITVNFSQGVANRREASHLRLSLEYDSHVLPVAQVEEIGGYYARVLAAMTADPHANHASVSFLPVAQRHQMLVEWAGQGRVPVPGSSLHETFAARARATPSAPAVVCGADELSYAELDQRSDRLARELGRRGVGPEVIVGVCLERTPRLVEAILGVLKAGGAYLPLDPAYPAERLAFMLDDSRAAVVVTTDDLVPRVAESGVRLVCLDELPEAPEAAEVDAAPAAVTPANAAYVIYTSGSTGRPKGVVVTHGHVTRLFAATQPWFGFDASDVWTLFHSYAFDFSVWELWGALLHGGRLVIVPYLTSRSPEATWDLLRFEGVTVLNQTPSAFRQLLAAEDTAAGGAEELALRYVIFGGEGLDFGALTPWFARHGERAPRLVNMYGITETTVHVTYRPIAAADASPAAPSLIGIPIPDLRVYLLDASGQPVPIGIPGEIHVGGAGPARGYLGRPGLTAQRFVPDPFGGTGGRLYRSGDLARYHAGGDLEFLGRIDQQVKIRGFRIELGEVAAALEEHPRVRRAVVTAGREPGASGEQRLVGYLLPEADARIELDEVREHLRTRLPDYMVPGAWVVLDELPLTANGKLDRRALPEPEAVQVDADTAFTAPRTWTEQLLASAWEEVLGVDRVGVEDNFFDLGGHSLLATRLTSRISKAFGVRIALSELFEAPTVRELAQRVEAAGHRSDAALPPLEAARRDGPTPLSYAQQRLWLIYEMEPASSLYNMPAALRLTGRLDTAALERSFDEVLRRHESLRTVFTAAGDEVAQVITPPSSFELPTVDLGALPEAAREGALERLAAEEARRPFDLLRGPVLRARLVRLAESEHALFFTVHHIVSDGWSTGNLVRELTELYEAFSHRRPSPLPEMELQYADYTVWQRGWLRGEVLEGEIEQWKEHLAGLPPVLELPTDRPRLASHSHRGAVLPVALSEDLGAALRRLGRRRGTTLFMTLLAGFEALLSRYTGERDFAVGSPIAGRNRLELEPLVGFFVNTLTLRADLSGNPSFSQLLDRTRATALWAQAHQELPFDKLVEALRPERALSHSPLFQVAFALENTPQAAIDLPGLQVRPLASPGVTAKFDLTLGLVEEAGGLRGGFEYAVDLFDPTSIRRLGAHLERLFEAVAAAPEQPLSALSLLSAAERAQLFHEWNDVAVALPETSLAGLFEAQARRSPQAPAVTFGQESLSYGDLDRRANRFARQLRKLGIGPEVPVGLLLERSADWLVAMLGVIKAGGAYVPLDPSYPPDRLAFMMTDTCLPVVISEERFAPLWEGSEARPLLVDRDRELLASGPGDAPPPAGGPDDLAYVIYTSGSTGRPKGVAVSQRAIARLVLDTNYVRLGPGSRVAQASNASFDAATFEIWGALLHGAQLVGAPRDVTLSPADFAVWLTEERIDVLFLTTALFNQIVAAAPAAFRDLDSLLFGGEAVDPERVRQVVDGTGPRRLLHVYGPTESTTFTSFHPVHGVGPGATTVPIGRPISSTTICVLGAGLTAVPIGISGELCVGGTGLARGYLRRPGLTAEKFVPDPFSREPGQRLYRTGDLCRLSARGEVEFHGRFDHQVKVRGFRIELGEVEAALAVDPRLRETVVLTRRDASGTLQLVACAVPEPEVDVTAAELREALAERLPDYMVPSGWIVLPRMPLTSNGKVDRKALAAFEVDSVAGGELVAPRDPVEEVLAGIWCDVLALPRLSVLDDFFELGGHSLLATQVISRVRLVFEVDLPLRDLFEAPTVRGLALRLEEILRHRNASGIPPIVPVLRDGELPLSFAQQRMWFLDQLEPGTPVFNVAVALGVDGALRSDVLEAGLREVVRRHEALRTVFAEKQGEPIQVILPDASIDLPVIDLSGLPAARRTETAGALTAGEAVAPFDLAQGPLLRVRLLRLAEHEHVALLTMHHIVSDGWSMGILVDEVTALYRAFVGGRPSPLPELAVQYADYAVGQRRWLEGEKLSEQLDYWCAELEGVPPVLELPTDRPRPPVQTHHGAVRTLRLPIDLSEQVEALARREGATLFMTLLVPFAALLSRYTGKEDFVLGSPIANRNRAEIEGLIGFFVNTLALRMDVSGDPSFREQLARVRRSTLDAYAHQDLPFERLVEELRIERSLDRSPLFQVMLMLQNAPVGNLDVPGLSFRPLPSSGRRAAFDWTLEATRGEEGLGLSLEYNTDLFDSVTAWRVLRHFEHALGAFVDDPERRLAAAGLVGAAERHQLLHEWNDVPREAASEVGFQQLFADSVAAFPDKVALIDAATGESVSYRELDRRADLLARLLRQRGVGVESRVGLLMERSVEMVVGILAVLKAGGAYVPFDPVHPRQRREPMARDARITLLLTHRGLEAEQSHDKVVLAHEALTAGASGEPLPAVFPQQAAYVIYTSGSTGRPKGVVVSHQALTAYTAAAVEAYGLRSDERVLQFCPISFDGSVEEIFPCLALGATLILRDAACAESAAAFFRHSREQEVTFLALPTAFWHELAAAVEDDPGLLPPSLRRITFGGERVLAEKVVAWQRRVPGRPHLINTYGPTETTVVVTAMGLTGRPRPAVEAEVPIGRPLHDARAFVVDRRLRSVPVGIAGELAIGGTCVSRGYLDRPALTAERFVPDPWSGVPGARLYKSGDRVRHRSDGALKFLDRVDRQVKVRGFRVELGEVESALCRHPGVDEAIVATRELPGGGKSLVGFLRSDTPPAPPELRQFLGAELPEHMVPPELHFLEAWPMTPNGKIDRQALLRIQSDRQTPDTVAARDSLELDLVRIWEQILDHRPIGVRDSFFELGGHSLLAVSLFYRVERQLGCRLSLEVLFQEPTIERLAIEVRRHRPSPPERSLLVEMRSGPPAQGETSSPGTPPRPLLVLVHPVGGHVLCYSELVSHLDAEQPVYGLRARGLEDGEQPLGRIEAMAEKYLAVLGDQLQERPFVLGGWSIGGLVAWEMAKKLSQQGLEADSLLLFDTWARQPAAGPEAVDERALLLSHFATDLGVRLDGLGEDEARELAAMSHDEQMGRLLEHVKAVGLVPPDFEGSRLTRLYHVFETHVRASEAYRPEPAATRTVLVRATGSAAEPPREPDLGWGALASSLEIHEVGGDHHSMIRTPHVQEIVQIVHRTLQGK